MKVSLAIDLLEMLQENAGNVDLDADLGIGFNQEAICRAIMNEKMRKNELPRLPDHAKTVAACGLPDKYGDYIVVRRNPHKGIRGKWQLMHLLFDAADQRWLNPVTNQKITSLQSHPVLAYWTPFGEHA